MSFINHSSLNFKNIKPNIKMQNIKIDANAEMIKMLGLFDKDFETFTIKKLQ